MVPMEREEYLRRVAAAYDAMDDRARRQQLRQMERAAADNPREASPAFMRLASVLPFNRAISQRG